MTKSVLIADDHDMIRKALCELFDSQDDFEVCGDAEDGKEAVEMAQVLLPDLILLDLSMPVMNGIEAACELKRRMPMVPIIVFSEYGDVLSEGRGQGDGDLGGGVQGCEAVGIVGPSAIRALSDGSVSAGFERAQL